MSLIEGVGDEVTNFFICLSVVVISYIAWTSTYISDQPLIRTVLILRQTRNRLLAEIQTTQEVLNLSQSQHVGPGGNEEEGAEDTATVETVSESNGTESTTTPTERTEEILIRTMDSNVEEASASSRIEESKSEVKKVDKKVEELAPEASSSDSNPPETESDQTISIKLKFINDDQRLVTGGLKELLGDFKKRHFQVELEAQKLVKLVFKGQVVQPDSLTLERCGFYDNCVVHCLIHQSTNSTPAAPTNSARFYFNGPTFAQNLPTGTGLGVQPNDWDLSKLLVCVLTFMLGAAWYIRYHYAQLFTVTTTVGLAGLTVLFTVSLYGHFFPDQEIRNVVE